jgi:hypothetical protein
MAIHRFIGDSQAPTPLSKLQTRRPVLGTGRIPEELRSMMQSRTYTWRQNLKTSPKSP